MAAIKWLGSEIAGYQKATWRWQRTMGIRPVQTEGRLLTAMSIADVQRAAHLWQRRAAAAQRRAEKPPHLRQFLCIHRFEGSWSDSGDPYWGGLQMDRGFMHTYAPRSLLRKGLANRWTALEQMWVAERAHRSGRGYGPWPNTARSCGLL